jgi:hypothetical protein
MGQGPGGTDDVMQEIDGTGGVPQLPPHPPGGFAAPPSEQNISGRYSLVFLRIWNW